MGIIGCPENPVTTNTSYPVASTNDVKIGIGSGFPNEIRLVSEDSRAWRRFTPVFLGMTLGGVNVTAGDTQNFSRYRLLRNHYLPEGAFVLANIKLRFGSSATFAAAAWEAQMPTQLPAINPFDYTTAMSSKVPVVGQWLAHDASANTFYEGSMFLGPSPTSHPLRFAFGDDAGSITGQITSTVPFTWASGDRLSAIVMMRVTVP